ESDIFSCCPLIYHLQAEASRDRMNERSSRPVVAHHSERLTQHTVLGGFEGVAGFVDDSSHRRDEVPVNKGAGQFDALISSIFVTAARQGQQQPVLEGRGAFRQRTLTVVEASCKFAAGA